MTTLRFQLRSARTHACLAERCGACICRVFQHSPDRRAVPPVFAGRRLGTLSPQSSSDFADRKTITTNPLEDLSHDRRLLFVDLISSLSIPFAARDVTISPHFHRRTSRFSLGALASSAAAATVAGQTDAPGKQRSLLVAVPPSYRLSQNVG